MPAAFATLFSRPVRVARRHDAAAGARRPHDRPGRTAARSAAARRSTAWSTSAATGSTTTAGATTTAARAGAMPTCCRTSAAPRTARGASTSTAPALRRAPALARLARAAIAYGLAPNDDFNGPSRTASAAPAHPARRAPLVRGGRLPAPGRRRGRTSRCETGALRHAGRDRGRPRAPACATCAAARSARRAPAEVVVAAGADQQPAAAAAVRASARPTQLREHGIRAWSPTCRASARACRTTRCACPDGGRRRRPNLWEEATPENMARGRRDRRGPMCSSGAETGGFVADPRRPARARPADRPAPGPAPDPRSRCPTAAASRCSRWRSTSEPRPAVGLRSADPPTRRSSTRATSPSGRPRHPRRRRAPGAEIAAPGPLGERTDGEHAPGEHVEDDDELRAWIRRAHDHRVPPDEHLCDGRGDDAPCDPSCACAASTASAWSTPR